MAKISKILLIKKEGCEFCCEVLSPTKNLCEDRGYEFEFKMKHELPKALIPGIYPYWYIFNENNEAIWHYHPDIEGSLEEALDEIEKT
jgi:hypothetical protein